MIRGRALSLALLIGLASASASAKAIYVSPTGNNKSPGTISEPVAAASSALDLAAPGDTIYFRAGRYPVSRPIWVGTPGITFSSHPGEKAILQGGTEEGPNNPVAVFIVVSNDVSLINLEIQGGSYYGVKIDIDKTPSTSGVVVRGCYIHHTGRDAIKTLNADRLLIEDCEISNTGERADNAEGIDSIGSVGVTIRRCYVHDTRTTGIYLKGGARDGVVEQCRIARAGHAGLLLGQDTDLEYMRDKTEFEAINCVGRNNVVEDTKGAGIGTYSGNYIRFENNTVYNAARENQAGFYVVMNHRDVPARQVSFRNNILVQLSERPMAFIVNMSGPLACDSNIYFRPGGGPYKFWQEIWPDTANYWQSFSDWQSALNVDRRSIIADPRLDAGNLYRLSAGSPAIDRGEPISGVIADYAGALRPQGKGYDIGAHETAAKAVSPPSGQD
jgi:hypothetical protein